MFLLDPTEGLSREELLQHIWYRDFTQAQREKALRIAESRGMTWIELLREVAAGYDAAIADPVQREEWLRTNEEIEHGRAMPFGGDPRLEQDGDV